MDILKEFCDYAARAIDGEGIYPFPGFCMMPDGKLEIAALAIGPDGCFQWFWEKVANECAAECIFGLDRETRDGQGTEFGDVLTCVYWKDGLDGKPWNTSFRIAVLNYQHSPRIVRPLDWDNTFWKKQMHAEVLSHAPSHRIRVVKATQ